MKQAIIVIGGYNSFWPLYLNMARRLENLSGLPSVGVPLMPWDWWSAGRARDATNILRRLQETVAWARRRLRAERFVLVGHSAGGVIGRLYLYDQPMWGQAYAGVDHVTALITLGSPHCGLNGTETGWFLTDQANRRVSGAFYADRVRYRTVAGRFVQGQQNGRRKERRAFRTYRFFFGRGDVWGDGTVPVPCAALPGAENLILDGIAHSVKSSRQWYGGSRAIIRRWWIGSMGDAI
jgi:pimeloyl-ACP methyl ester carboxylesterase